MYIINNRGPKHNCIFPRGGKKSPQYMIPRKVIRTAAWFEIKYFSRLESDIRTMEWRLRKGLDRMNTLRCIAHVKYDNFTVEEAIRSVGIDIKC